ncbi:hypothetical protein ABZ499_07965 [Streptomyces sp. NPDC019990]|uniref:hypothetical protein n=1 Tax=Streptomyces sp. NPDC019990 TaxID=3154693 RepID=UPI0033D80A75
MAKPKKNANNEGTIYQRKDGRWEGSAYVLTTDGTYKRRSVYGKIRDIRAFLATTAVTCQCCAQGKDRKRPEHKRRCCALGKCCKKLPSDRTVRFLPMITRAALSTPFVRTSCPATWPGTWS